MSELIKYLPEFMQEIKEMKIIMSIEDDFFMQGNDNLNLSVKKVFDNQFINTSTIEGIERYENMLNIVSRQSEELDVRKFKVFMKFNEKLPYTIPKLKEQLSEFCGKDGYNIDIDVIRYFLTVRISLKSKKLFNDIMEMLERMVPLNIIIDLDLIYNNHLTLGKFKHKVLGKYTHKGLKDEVIS